MDMSEKQQFKNIIQKETYTAKWRRTAFCHSKPPKQMRIVRNLVQKFKIKPLKGLTGKLKYAM